MTVVGTRPEIIRLSRVLAALDQHCDHILVHTGQNHDYELNQVFFDDLGIRSPDHFLEAAVDGAPMATIGKILAAMEQLLKETSPDALLVLGDTNSCLSAIPAKRARIPIFHMEAGNRCFDANVPEETNRRLVDHVADYNLVYTEHARRNLLAEGVHPRHILLTGSPMREVIAAYRDSIDDSDVLTRLGLNPQQYLLVSAHREENVDDPERLTSLLECVVSASTHFDKPVIFSTHPRTRKHLDPLTQSDHKRIRFHEPFGYHDYNRLQLDAACVLSDSGTIAEESAILGFPAITLRESIERPEALDAGAIIMTGLDSRDVLDAMRIAMENRSSEMPHGYEIESTAERVLRFIVSTARRHRTWMGLR